MIKLTWLFAPLLFVMRLHAQSIEEAGTMGSTYNQAIGIKFPGGLSITNKKFVTDAHSVEGQVTAWNKGFRIAGLYEFNYFSFTNVAGLAWFVGPGAHIGFWKNQYSEDYNSKVDVGVDGIIGLDYKLKGIPINASVDWEPALTLVGTAGFTPVYGGVAIRYVFK